MLSNVHIFCFAASYAVALVLEISRLFFRAPVRIIVTVGFSAAGLLAHTVFVVMRATPNPEQPPPLSSWFDWLLLVAWGVAVMYLITVLRRPQAAMGIFMLPVVLLLIGVASLFSRVDPFPRDQALCVWGVIHGVALLLGAVAVMLGLVAGSMYLVQSYRLKHKLPPRQGLRLPSLEWLQGVNRRSLVASSCLLAAGLLAGVVLNLVQHPMGMPWTDPVVWTSGGLFLWLVAVLLFESLYKPAQQGRKVAYLTLASFVFLGLVLGIVLFGPSQHATSGLLEEGHDIHLCACGCRWFGEARECRVTSQHGLSTLREISVRFGRSCRRQTAGFHALASVATTVISRTILSTSRHSKQSVRWPLKAVEISGQPRKTNLQNQETHGTRYRTEAGTYWTAKVPDGGVR